MRLVGAERGTIGSIQFEIGGQDAVGDDAFVFLFQFFEGRIGTTFPVEAHGNHVGTILIMGVDQAGKAKPGKGEGAQGNVALSRVFGIFDGCIGGEDELFEGKDLLFDVEQFDAFEGGGVPDMTAMDVDTVLVGVFISEGSAALFGFSGGCGLQGRDDFIGHEVPPSLL